MQIVVGSPPTLATNASDDMYVTDYKNRIVLPISGLTVSQDVAYRGYSSRVYSEQRIHADVAYWFAISAVLSSAGCLAISAIAKFAEAPWCHLSEDTR